MKNVLKVVFLTKLFEKKDFSDGSKNHISMLCINS
jgi:hypothetical protein